MLATSNYNVNDIVTVKLANGEELVGKYTQSNDKDFVMVRPLVFTVNPQNGQAMLIPWLMSVDPKSTQPIALSKSNILAITKTIKDIADNYMQATSGIVTAPASTLEGLSNLK
jgi:hypothetical protein